MCPYCGAASQREQLIGANPYYCFNDPYSWCGNCPRWCLYCEVCCFLPLAVIANRRTIQRARNIPQSCCEECILYFVARQAEGGSNRNNNGILGLCCQFIACGILSCFQTQQQLELEAVVPVATAMVAAPVVQVMA